MHQSSAANKSFLCHSGDLNQCVYRELMENHSGVPWLELAREADPCCTGRFHVTLSLCGSNNLKSEQWLGYLAECE